MHSVDMLSEWSQRLWIKSFVVCRRQNNAKTAYLVRGWDACGFVYCHLTCWLSYVAESCDDVSARTCTYVYATCARSCELCCIMFWHRTSQRRTHTHQAHIIAQVIALNWVKRDRHHHALCTIVDVVANLMMRCCVQNRSGNICSRCKRKTHSERTHTHPDKRVNVSERW